MSDIGEARRAAAEARTAFDAALVDVDTATASQTYYAFAVEQWKLSHQAETREPRPIMPGAAHWDVAMRPPPSDEQVAVLEKAVGKAERKLNRTRQALTEAAAAGVPKREPSTTGWSAVKSFRFLGVAYDPGDEFDPSIAEPGKLSQMIGARLIAATSPAGADHA